MSHSSEQEVFLGSLCVCVELLRASFLPVDSFDGGRNGVKLMRLTDYSQ